MKVNFKQIFIIRETMEVIKEHIDLGHYDEAATIAIMYDYLVGDIYIAGLIRYLGGRFDEIAEYDQDRAWKALRASYRLWEHMTKTGGWKVYNDYKKTLEVV